MSIYQKIANIQDQILNIPKDGKNLHFSNTYATYEQVMEVLHPLLRKEGLMICHGFGEHVEGMVAVRTRLVDVKLVGATTGTEIVETLYIPMSKNDPQMAGSAITYAKRYTVLAMLGLGTEDDDGEKATTSPKPTTVPKEDYDAVDNSLCRIHSNQDGSAVALKHHEKDGKEWWSHPTAKGGWCYGTDTKYNREA